MSAAVPKTHCHVMILVFPVTLLFVLHAYATDLNGAWANDPNVCAQIFVGLDCLGEFLFRRLLQFGDRRLDVFPPCAFAGTGGELRTLRVTSEFCRLDRRFRLAGCRPRAAVSWPTQNWPRLSWRVFLSQATSRCVRTRRDRLRRNPSPRHAATRPSDLSAARPEGRGAFRGRG